MSHPQFALLIMLAGASLFFLGVWAIDGIRVACGVTAVFLLAFVFVVGAVAIVGFIAEAVAS